MNLESQKREERGTARTPASTIVEDLARAGGTVWKTGHSDGAIVPVKAIALEKDK